MPVTAEKFEEAVWRIVAGIRPGQVMGYGEVARAAGYPRHARMVSRAMSRSPDPLPWYRVVRSNRTLAFEPGSEYYEKQKRLLEKEGVRVIRTRVFPAEYSEDMDLDTLIWGPQNEDP